MALDATTRERSGPLRVMLVDDHEVVRSGLRAMLEAAGDIRVVAEAGTVAEAVSRAEG
ncbi:MAG TPA: DNA-binding response regulator, partial [Candidatus Dormibacteraeota bacterium]|nr:DNA-binding response regulator [Candidatus Dormibacteraeota bacterium]HZV49301.1 DNA-binding response regulator [Candidatus Dormibacteraeota bacterium]